MLVLADIAFLTFHTGLIAFNVFGWLWKPSRRWNLLTQSLTLASWVGMGAWKGWGYCLCTDWHWQIRREMGILDDPPTYIGFLIQKTTGILPSENFVFWLTLSAFTTCFFGSLTLNLRDRARRNTASARP